MSQAIKTRPNFLFLLSDQHRRDWLGCEGQVPVRTPHIDALARRGMRFTRALCASPVCGPSRACLASGKFYENCGVPDHTTDYPLAQTTYYSLLREAGYHVAGCGKFDLHKASPSWGIDGEHLLPEWGFSAGLDSAGKWDAVKGAATPRDPYLQFLHQRGLADIHVADYKSRRLYLDTHPTPLPEDAYCDNWIGGQGLRLLRESPADKPWHLVVNFAGPHNPMDVTSEMHKWYRNPPVDFPPCRLDNGTINPCQHQEIRRNYAAMIENIDRWVGRFHTELEQRGELANTVVVYSSDHGEMLGDHGRWEKHTPYEASVGIPLVVAGPGVLENIPTDALVSLIDVGATFLDCAGVDPEPAMESLSLHPVLTGETQVHRGHLHSALGPWSMVQTQQHKLVIGFTPSLEINRIMKFRSLPPPELDPELWLFDLAADPDETINIAPNHPGLVSKLHDLLTTRKHF